MERAPAPRLALVLALAAGACLPRERPGGAGRFKDFSVGAAGSADAADEPCADYYHVERGLCRKTGCPEGTYEATAEVAREVAGQLDDAVANGDVEEDEALRIRADIDGAKALCVARPGVLRPDGEVFIDPGFCICLNDRQAMIGTCEAHCAGEVRDTEDRYLLEGSVTLGAAVEQHPRLGDLSGWCENSIPGGLPSPGCRFVLEDGRRTHQRNVRFTGRNRFEVDLTGLALDRIYVGRIVETQSGSGASSGKIQFHLRAPEERDSIPDGQLKVVPVLQYSCFERVVLSEGDDVDVWHTTARRHFYLPSHTRPEPLGPSQSDRPGHRFCHDIQRLGLADSVRHGRLERVPWHFALWDAGDSRFKDRTGGEDGKKDGVPDISNALMNDLRDRHNVTRRSIDLFRPLRAKTKMDDPDGGVPIGYVMVPWVDARTDRAYCPGRSHYEGFDPLFEVLGGYVGVDTEGLFQALAEPEHYDDEAGDRQEKPRSVLYIREGALRDLWFHLDEEGRCVRPGFALMGRSRPTRFHWPPDPDHPCVKKPDQRLYKLIDASSSEAGGGDASDKPLPRDQRIGCVPSLD